MEPESIQDLFEELGPIRVRSMFGGRGLYSGDQIFGIAAADGIYLKADETSRPAFEKAGSHPFTYERSDGTAVATSYWSLPDSALDDPAEAARWAKMALDAARRFVASRPAKTKGRPKPHRKAGRGRGASRS